MELNIAELSELILALRRDEEQIELISEKFSAFFKTLFGDLRWIRCHKYFPFLCRFLYFASTNLCNLQTPGQEYVQLIQVSDQSNPKAVSFLQRCLFVGFETFGDIFVKQLFKLLRIIIEKLERRKTILTHAAQLTLSILETENYSKLYKAFFFAFHLKYATLSRRFSGISYLSLRSQSNLQVNKLFSFIGVSIIAQCLITFALKAAKEIKKNQLVRGSNELTLSDQCYEDKTNHVCIICCLRKLPVCTPCGHLFCWDCVIDYSIAEETRSGRGRCPNCRNDFFLNRVIPLLNY